MIIDNVGAFSSVDKLHRAVRGGRVRYVEWAKCNSRASRGTTSVGMTIYPATDAGLARLYHCLKTLDLPLSRFTSPTGPFALRSPFGSRTVSAQSCSDLQSEGDWKGLE